MFMDKRPGLYTCVETLHTEEGEGEAGYARKYQTSNKEK